MWFIAPAGIGVVVPIVFIVLIVLLASVCLVLDIGCLDLCVGLLDDDRVALDIFAVHLLGGLEEIVGVAETDKAIAFGFRGSFVADDSGLLNRLPPRKGLQKGFVCSLSRQVSDEEAQVGRIPFQQCIVRPFLATALSNNRLRLIRLLCGRIYAFSLCILRRGEWFAVFVGLRRVGALPLRNLGSHVRIIIGTGTGTARARARAHARIRTGTYTCTCACACTYACACTRRRERVLDTRCCLV